MMGRGGRGRPIEQVELARPRARLTVDDRIAMVAAAALVIFVAMVSGAITLGLIGGHS